jgi:predicted acyl esterase
MIHRTALLAVGMLFPFLAQGQLRDALLRPEPHIAAIVASSPVRHDTNVVVGVDTLDATFFVPPSAPPDSLGYPAMIFVPGFGESKDGDTLNASLWAGSGYASFCYSVRGQGKSGGQSTIMGPAEHRDFVSVVEFVKGLRSVNKRRVGIQGGSQGGLHALWAAAESLVVAATADVITPRWASDMLANGCFRTTLVTLLQMPGVRYDPVRDTLWQLLREEDHDGFLRVFAPERDVDTAALARSMVPLAVFAKWQDHFFPVGEAPRWFGAAQGPRKLYLGTGGHYSDSIPAELAYQWSTVNRWHQEFTLGKSSGILSEPPLAVAASSLPVQANDFFTWTRSEGATWPPAGVESYRLFLLPDSLLMPVLVSGRRDSASLTNSYSGGYSLDSARADRFQGPHFEQNVPRHILGFTSRVIQNDVLLCGQPRLHCSVWSGSVAFPLHARIFEVESTGVARLVDRINFVARHWIPGSAGIVEADGPAHAHRFSRGSRIRIELTNLDIDTRPGWGSAPLVLPLFHDAEVTVYADSAHGTYVEFPFLGNPVLGTTIAGFDARFDPDRKEVLVTWSTLVEADNREFRVMKRRGGEADTLVGTVQPLADSVSKAPLSYSFIDSTVEEGEWTYHLLQVDRFGLVQGGGEKAVSVVLNGVREDVPLVTALGQNYPNPFNPRTAISYQLSAVSEIRLVVYDILGREVRRLVEEREPAGRYSVAFDGTGLSSGVYICRMAAGKYTGYFKMVLMK